jgi:hypothetical protein
MQVITLIFSKAELLNWTQQNDHKQQVNQDLKNPQYQQNNIAYIKGF